MTRLYSCSSCSCFLRSFLSVSDLLFLWCFLLLFFFFFLCLSSVDVEEVLVAVGVRDSENEEEEEEEGDDEGDRFFFFLCLLASLSSKTFSPPQPAREGRPPASGLGSPDRWGKGQAAALCGPPQL